MSHGSVDSLAISHRRAPVESGDHKAEITPHPDPAKDQDQTVLNPSQSLADKHVSDGAGDSDIKKAGAPNQNSGDDETSAGRVSKDLGDPDGRDVESQKEDQLSGKFTRSKLKELIYVRIFGRLLVHREPIEPKYGYSSPSFLRPYSLFPPTFRSVKILIILRLALRSSCFVFTILVSLQFLGIPVFLTLSFIAWILRYNRIYGLGKVRFASPGQIWKVWRYPQWIWESSRSMPLDPFWWTIYLLISDMDEFEQNFINAWRVQTVNLYRREALETVESDEQYVDVKYYPGLLTIFIGDECLKVPMFMDRAADDKEALELLKMWYRYFKIKRGLLELIIPRSLSRIDCVKIEGVQTILPGIATQNLDCGRGLVHFYDPKTVRGEMVIKNAIQDRALPENRDTQGLEFVRRLNRRAVVAVILTPPLLSAVAIVVWLAVFLRKPKKSDDSVDVQAVTTAAFTIAVYLVTAGAFVTALAAYFDSIQNDAKYAGKEHEDIDRVCKHSSSDGKETGVAKEQNGQDDEIKILKVEMEKLQIQLQQQTKLMEQHTMPKTQQPTGLTNTGNDCFALASLQCLSNCSSFVQACQTWLEGTQASIGALAKSAILLLEALHAVNQNGSTELDSVRVTYEAFVEELKACKDPSCTIFKIPAKAQQDANEWLMWFLGSNMLATPAEKTLNTEIVDMLRCTDKDCKGHATRSIIGPKDPTIQVNSNGETESSLHGLFRTSGFHEWRFRPDFRCPECKKLSVEGYLYVKTGDNDIIIQLVRGNNNNQKSNANIDFDIDNINLPVEDGKTKGFYVRAIEQHKGDTKDSGHYKAYLRKDMDTRTFDEKNDGISKKATDLDDIVNHRVYLLYCSPKPVATVSAATIVTTSKEKQPSSPNESLANATVSSDHKELPPKEDSVNQISEMELQQAAVNKTTDSTLMEEAKEHTIVYAKKDGNTDANKTAETEKISNTAEAQKLVDANKTAETEKIPNTTEVQKLAEVTKANVAEVVEKAEAVSATEKDGPGHPEKAPNLTLSQN